MHLIIWEIRDFFQTEFLLFKPQSVPTLISASLQRDASGKAIRHRREALDKVRRLMPSALAQLIQKG